MALGNLSLICPNCGRRNPAGATFCSRCRQLLPLAAKYGGSGFRRTVIAEPTGGGGGGVLVLGVALLAGFLFIGGGAAIYLSTPPQPANSNLNGLIGDLTTFSPSPLPAFTQETAQPGATPEPTPTPFFFSPDPGSFAPASFDVTPSATPIVVVTPTPTPLSGPTPPPTARPTHGPTSTPRPTNNGPTPTPRPTNNPTPTP